MKPVPVAGVDVSKDFSEMCILAPDNTVFRRVKIYHDLAYNTGEGQKNFWAMKA